jgi:hypothetical protein
MDARQMMQPVAHRRHHTEITATTAQRPEQLVLLLDACKDNISVRQHDFRLQ